MSRKRVNMHRLQELVRLHRLDTQAQEVARVLRMSRTTERKYREAIQLEGLLLGDSNALPEMEVLKAAVQRHYPPASTPQQRSSVERWRRQIEKMVTKGAGAKAIYDALRTCPEADFEGSYSAIRRFVANLTKARPAQPDDVAIPMTFAPGSTAQVDFGFVGRLLDPESGEQRKAWVFVMVLGHSRHRFDRIVFDQRSTTWLQLHAEAFAFFGGVPRVVVPDNLKAAVIRASFGVDRPDGALNRSYRELARHYGFKVDPTPPRAPEKKGQVESGVKYVKRNFFVPRDFEDIHAANAQLDRWVLDIAGTRIHGTTGRQPLSVFEAEEKPALLPLPTTAWQHIEWRQAQVHRDCRFMFDRRLYPVPWRFIGKQVWVRAIGGSLEVYFDDTRIITHERGVEVPDAVLHRCLPEGRRELRYRSPSHWLERAEAIGETVASYIREVFASDGELSKLRVVQSMVTHLEKFPTERAEAACRRASYFGNFTYLGLRDILRKALDFQPLPVAVIPGDTTANQPPRFARNVAELMHQPLESTHEPH